jgi:hypothetical protein
MAQEHQIVLSRLHEKSAEIVAELLHITHEVYTIAVRLGADVFHGGLGTSKQGPKRFLMNY